MSPQLLSAFQSLPVRQRAALEPALAALLATLSESGPLPVRVARDKFTAVNKAAREGKAQLLRGEPGEETVLVSVRDLATIIQAAASCLTLGDALAVSGFRPAGGRVIFEESFEGEDMLRAGEHEEAAAS